MKRTLRVLQTLIVLTFLGTALPNQTFAQWDQASPNTNTNVTRNGNVTVGNSTASRSVSNTKMQVNGGTNTYAANTGVRADVEADNGSTNQGTAYGILGVASSYNANGSYIGARGTATVDNIRTSVSTKTSSIFGGYFVADIDDPVNVASANTGRYLISGMAGRLQGNITTYPGDGFVTAISGEDLIQGSNTWAGYFVGRGYFEDNVGIGTTNPIPGTGIDVRSGNIFTSPSSAAIPDQFAAVGESFGDCDIYGFTARENSGTYVNLGIQDGTQPTLSFNGTNGEFDIVCDDDTAGCGSKVATFYCPGNIAIDVNGGGVFAGGTFIPGGRTIMTEVEEVANAMDRIQNLRAVNFNYSQDDPTLFLPAGQQVGFIAEDMEKVMPEAVATTSYGEKAINMEAVVPYLVEGVKELDNRSAADQLVNDEQSIRIRDLENEVAELKALVSQLLGDQSASKGAQGSLDVNVEMPRLDQNAPNPFDQVTRISYFVPAKAGMASIQVVNMTGQVMGQYDAQIGNGHLEIPVGSMTDGIYFYSLIVDGEKVATRRMVITK